MIYKAPKCQKDLGQFEIWSSKSAI